MQSRPLAETRNVDDQVLWLDDGHIAYGLPNDETPAVTDIWRLDVDDDTGPELVVRGGWSPAVLR